MLVLELATSAHLHVVRECVNWCCAASYCLLDALWYLRANSSTLQLHLLRLTDYCAPPFSVLIPPRFYYLQLLPTMVGSRVRISASSCNIGIRDANCWFDSSVLVRKFQLDLSNPFERAVALLVLFLIASHQTYVIGLSEYYDPDSRSTTNLGMVLCE
jgi:hypothetical protein